MSVPHISRLFYYPIKSFRGVEVRKMKLGMLGPDLDRQWMLVDDKLQFFTQRQIPDLAKIGLAILDEARIELTQNGELITDFGLEETEDKELQVTVWKDQVAAFEVSGDVSSDISKILGRPVKLVRISDEGTRSGRFADSRQLHVLTDSSVHGLEEKAKMSVSVARFRPNIVISGAPAHAEDTWTHFKANKISFERLKPTTRCKITCTHPLTGEVGSEPLRTLMTYRKIEKGIAFGQYYGNDRGGEITTGLPIEIV